MGVFSTFKPTAYKRYRLWAASSDGWILPAAYATFFHSQKASMRTLFEVVVFKIVSSYLLSFGWGMIHFVVKEKQWQRNVFLWDNPRLVFGGGWNNPSGHFGSSLMSMGLRILTPARFFSSMSWLRILALVACYVSVTRSSTSYDDGDTAAGALPVGRGPLECFRGSCRRSRRRHQAVSSNASQSDCCGLRSCGDLAGRRTSDCNAGHACGVGLQIGEENLLDQQWRRMARVGGPQPLGDHQRRQREEAGGRAGGNPENQEVETKQHLGPDGRFGVHGGARGGQTEMAEEIQGDHGGISPGRGGADAGTSIGDQKEGGWRSSAFCGLLHLCALRKAGNEDSQVQELPVRSFNGGLHGKGTPDCRGCTQGPGICW